MIRSDQTLGGLEPANPESNTKLLYSYEEARAQLGDVPRNTFARWIADGILRPICIGQRRKFIRREDLLRLANPESVTKVG